MGKWFKENLGWIIVTVLTGIVGSGITILYNYYQNKVQYLDYYVYPSESILKNVNEIGGSIDFRVDNNKVSNLSTMDIYFVNATNSDFTNVPLYIDLYPKDLDSLKIISINVYGQNNIKENVQQIPTSPSDKKNGIRLGYKFEVVNRSEQEPVISIRLLFEGAKIPDFKIKINKLGVEARQKALLDNNNSSLKDYLISLSIGLILGFIIIIVSNLLQRKLSDKRFDEMLKEAQARNELLKSSVERGKYPDLQ